MLKCDELSLTTSDMMNTHDEKQLYESPSSSNETDYINEFLESTTTKSRDFGLVPSTFDCSGPSSNLASSEPTKASLYSIRTSTNTPLDHQSVCSDICTTPIYPPNNASCFPENMLAPNIFPNPSDNTVTPKSTVYPSYVQTHYSSVYSNVAHCSVASPYSDEICAQSENVTKVKPGFIGDSSFYSYPFGHTIPVQTAADYTPQRCTGSTAASMNYSDPCLPYMRHSLDSYNFSAYSNPLCRNLSVVAQPSVMAYFPSPATSTTNPFQFFQNYVSTEGKTDAQECQEDSVTLPVAIKNETSSSSTKIYGSNKCKSKRKSQKEKTITRHSLNQNRNMPRNKPLNEKAVQCMEAWYKSHAEHPYPTTEDKQLMSQIGNITLAQVNSWFANRRNRSDNTRPKNNKKRLQHGIGDFAKELALRTNGLLDAQMMTYRLNQLINGYLDQ